MKTFKLQALITICRQYEYDAESLQDAINQASAIVRKDMAGCDINKMEIEAIEEL